MQATDSYLSKYTYDGSQNLTVLRNLWNFSSLESQVIGSHLLENFPDLKDPASLPYFLFS